MMNWYQRRDMLRLAAGGGFGLMFALSGCSQAGRPVVADADAPLPAELRLAGPPGIASLPLLRLIEQNNLHTQAPDTTLTFNPWRSPDQLRADTVSDNLHLAATPTNVAANLYRRGIPLQLLNVHIWGILYLLTTDPTLGRWDALPGAGIAIPLKGDMPDLVFSWVARSRGLDPQQDLALQYTASANEALQLLLSGRVQAAVLTEPAASAAQLQGTQRGVEVLRTLNLQEEWGAIRGGMPRIPQAGTFVMPSLSREHPALVTELMAELRDAVTWVREHPVEAAQLAEQRYGAPPAAVFEQALPRVGLEYVPATEARPELEAFFSALKEMAPEAIGGDLPDDAFYGI
jgi:NitT/TauT family transport system substrate-binding protein